MEVTQFTYFQQVGGFDCTPVAGEITYGLERLAMYIQGVDRVYDLKFNNEGVSYGDVFLESERQFSAYNFEYAKTDFLFDQFREAQEQCKELLTAKLPLPAYDHAIKRSEEPTSELQSLMSISYAVFCLKKKTHRQQI